jgi:D-glycero-D-manno-heptose 1,7-bisphosphate phosphatase
MQKKAIFFDRDGVLIKAPIDKNNKPKSIINVDQIELSENIYDICEYYRKDFYLIMITNQPDVSRKVNTKTNVDLINMYLKNILNLNDVFVCYCSDDNCKNRKPNAGMLFKAKDKYGLDIKSCYFIGDRWRDIDAGYKFGCKTILIDRGYSEKLNFRPNYVIKSLKDIFSII